MGRLAYAHALHLAPDNAEALAGFVRCQVAAETKLSLMAEGGIDVAERLNEVQSSSPSVGLAGAAAADAALSSAVAAALPSSPRHVRTSPDVAPRAVE